MAAQPSALASRGSISRMRQPHSDAGSGAGKERPEKQFKEGMQLITEAFGHFSRSMTEEVDYWKQLSNLQRQQVATLEAEAQRLKQANAELERMSSSQAREIAALSEAKTSIQAECDGLRKTMNELESFRRSIVSMVAQGPVSGAGPPRDSRCFDDLDGLSSTSTTVFDRRAPSRVDSAIDGSPKNVVRSVKSHFSTASAAASDSILAEPSLNATDSLDFSLTSQPYKESNAPKSRRPSVFSGGDTFESLFEVKESEYELSPGDIPTDLPDKAPIERSPFSSSARLQSRNFESDSDYELFSPLNRKTGIRDFRQAAVGQRGTPSSAKFRSSQLAPFRKSKQEDHSPAAPSSQPAQRDGGAPDASEIYRRIREASTSEEFQAFAAEIAAFNASKASAEETIARIGKIVRDELLFEQMKGLIRLAVGSEKGH